MNYHVGVDVDLLQYGEIGHKISDLLEETNEMSEVQQKEFSDIINEWLNTDTIPFKDKMLAIEGAILARYDYLFSEQE